MTALARAPRVAGRPSEVSCMCLLICCLYGGSVHDEPGTPEATPAKPRARRDQLTRMFQSEPTDRLLPARRSQR